MPRKPRPGDDVWYQTDSRNGLDYFLPAKVTVTKDSHPGDYPCIGCGTPSSEREKGLCDMGCEFPENPLPMPSSDTHVHLTVFTPGGFGTKIHEQGIDSVSQEPESDEDFVGASGLVPGSGTYVELDVPLDEVDRKPRTWHWPSDWWIT